MCDCILKRALRKELSFAFGKLQRFGVEKVYPHKFRKIMETRAIEKGRMNREQFDKEVKDFYCAGVSKEIRVYELLKELEFDFCLKGQTALECVERESNTEVMEFLRNYPKA